MPQALKRYGYDPDKKENETLSEVLKKFSLEENIETKVIDDNIGYMKVNSFMPYDEVKDKNTIKSFINEIKDSDGLIIDIRGNGGGSSRFCMDNIVALLTKESLTFNYYYFTRGGEFSDNFFNIGGRLKIDNDKHLKELKDLKDLPPEIFTDFKYYTKEVKTIKTGYSINFKGKIFLLVDEGVYSAAEMFAVSAKETGFATLIGETTGGDGITIDPALCTLPNSGVVFRFSYVMGTTESGVCNEEFKTVPHYIVDAEITENIKDDKCIQKAIELVGTEK